MNQLKEFSILETFRGLEAERQRVLLEQLIRETNLITVTRQFDSPNHEKFYEFLRKQWPKMSNDFFYESLRRWEILREKSYGNENISSCDVGDLYLQAGPWKDDYSEWPFRCDKTAFFYGDILEECKWEHMHICVLLPGCEHSTNYSIKDLMELTVEKFDQKMKEFNFL